MSNTQLESLLEKHCWVMVTGFLLLAWLIIAGQMLEPVAGSSNVAIIFPPWWDGRQVMSALSGTDVDVIRMGAISSIIVVQIHDAGWRTQLKKSGALFFANPIVTGGCTPDKPRP